MEHTLLVFEQVPECLDTYLIPNEGNEHFISMLKDVNGLFINVDNMSEQQNNKLNTILYLLYDYIPKHETPHIFKNQVNELTGSLLDFDKVGLWSKYKQGSIIEVDPSNHISCVVVCGFIL